MFKYMSFFRRLVRLLYQFFYVMLILNSVYGLFNQPIISFKWWLYVFGLLAVSYTLRDVMSRGIVLFFGHAAVGVLTFFVIRDVYLKYVLMVVLLVFFIDALIYVHNDFNLKRSFEAPYHAVILGLCSLGIGWYFHNTDLLKVAYVLTVCILMMYFVTLYIEGLESHLEKTSFLEGAPLKQIISVNTLIITGILLGSVIVIIVGNLLHFDELLMNVWEYILFFLKIILVIVLAILQFIFIMLGLGTPTKKNAMENLPQVSDKPSMIADILQFILTAAIIAFIVYIIFSFFKWLIRLLILRHRKDTDIVEDIKSKKRSGVAFEKYTDPDKLSGNSPEIRARKIYRKKVFNFKRFFTPNDASTTGDILKMMNSHSSLDKESTKESAKGSNKIENLSQRELEIQSRNDELREMYNEVRYGGVHPDNAFLKKMKKL